MLFRNPTPESQYIKECEQTPTATFSTLGSCGNESHFRAWIFARFTIILPPNPSISIAGIHETHLIQGPAGNAWALDGTYTGKNAAAKMPSRLIHDFNDPRAAVFFLSSNLPSSALVRIKFASDAILPYQAGMKITFAMLAALLPGLFLSAKVSTEVSDGTVEVNVSGKPVLVYHTATVQPPEGMDPVYARSGFIHPLYSPSGKVLTDPFPIGHVHQHGIFNAWTQTTFKHAVVDFWNQRGKSGYVEHLKLGGVKEDSFEARLRQVSAKKGPAIHEEWKVSVRNSENPLIVDMEIEQQCATTDEIYLHPYHYGGFAFRGSAHWSSEDESHFEGLMQILTADGITSIEKSNHTRPKWLAVYGKIEGETAGFAVLGHPSNFRHPQPVRVHPRMPYFVFSPVVAGSFILQPGFAYESKYRIITFDGEPNAETIEAWYQTYTE